MPIAFRGRSWSCALPLLAFIAPGDRTAAAPIAPAPNPRVSSAQRVPLEAAFDEAASLGDPEDGLLAIITSRSARGDAREAPRTLRRRSHSRTDATRCEGPGVRPRDRRRARADRRGGGGQGGQGLRELYVALTRPTTTLVVVHGSAPADRSSDSTRAARSRRRTKGRIPPCRRYTRSRGVSSRTGRAKLLGVRAHRHLARLTVLEAR